MEKYYVMYWNDRADYPVAIYEVMAEDMLEAEDIAKKASDGEYDDFPILTATEDFITAADLKRYKNSYKTSYYKM